MGEKIEIKNGYWANKENDLVKKNREAIVSDNTWEYARTYVKRKIMIEIRKFRSKIKERDDNWTIFSARNLILPENQALGASFFLKGL